MNSGFLKNRGINVCLIKGRWLLLSSIAISLMLLSCSPRSVRNGQTRTLRYPVKEKAVESKSASEINKDEVLEAQNQLEKELNLPNTNRSDTFYLDPRSGIVLPKPTGTDIVTVFDEQENINKKVSSLQTDVKEIKNTLEFIKTELLNKDNPQQEAVAGEYYQEGSTPVKKSNVMLSDEKVIKKTQPSKPKQVKKQVNSNSVPKQKTKTTNSGKQKKEEDENSDAIDFSQSESGSDNFSGTTGSQYSGFNKAMDEFKNKNYRNAINELNNMLKNDKNPENTGKYNYWLGESHFGLNQYDKAVKFFEKVLNSNNNAKKDDAMIMIAEANVRSGKIEEAKKAFSDLITNYPKSRYIPRARKMLQQF